MKHLLVIGALLVLCACSAPPAYVSPYDAPIALSINQRVETHEPERFVCTTPAALLCTPVLAARVRNAARDCVCLR